MKGKVVLITGASSGIGEACAEAFAAAGAKLLLAARRLERLEALSERLTREHHCQCRCLKLDVRSRSEVESALRSLEGEWSEIDVLVNNAGLSRGLDKFHESSIDDWEEMIDTNLKGLLYVSRSIVPGMVERGRGHVINLGSIAGHQVYPKGNVYCATKHAVRALTEALRSDLLGTSVRVSSVDPGMVETEFSLVRFHGDAERSKQVYEGLTPLSAADVADAVLYCATRPMHVNVSELVLMPTAQASAMLTHRKNS